MLLYIPVASVAEIVIMMLSITVGSVVTRKLNLP